MVLVVLFWVQFLFIQFLSLSAEELLIYLGVSVRVGVRMKNVKANVKVKAHGSRASGDCGTSGLLENEYETEMPYLTCVNFSEQSVKICSSKYKINKFHIFIAQEKECKSLVGLSLHRDFTSFST